MHTPPFFSSIFTRSFFGLFFALFSFSSSCLFGEPVVKPASRTEQPINQIRKIFYQIPQVNRERALLGLAPVINLSIGQPHIGFQKRTIDSMIRYLEGLKEMRAEALALEMGYSHSAGVLETREWIARFLSASYPEVKEGFTLEEVMVTNGATGALTNALKVLIEEGDEVAVFAPYFAGYENQVKSCGGKLVAIPLILDRSRSSLLRETLEAHPRIKIFIWCDPSNPTGAKADRRELFEIAEVLREHPNCIVAHDEVYKEIVLDKNAPSLLSIAPDLKPRSLVIRSLAKDILGAPGIRAGMIAAPTRLLTPEGSRVNLIELMSNEQLRDITSVSILVQKMLVFALEQKLSGESEAWEEAMRQEYSENVQVVSSALKRIGLFPLVEPRGAFYVMIDATPLLGKKIPEKIGVIEGLNEKIGNELKTDLDVAAYFLHAGVAVVPGSGFGTDHSSFRISCAKRRVDLLEAVQRIERAIESLID